MILEKLFSRSNLNDPSTPITSANLLSSMNLGFRSRSGETVSAGRMMQIGPIWQGVTLLGGDVGKTPCDLFRRVDRPGATGHMVRRMRQKAYEHAAWKIVRRRAGSQTSNIFFNALVGHGALFGNSYARVRRGGAGFRPTGVDFVHSDHVQPKYEKGQRFYVYKDPKTGKHERARQDQMIHIPGTTVDALGGLSVVRYARDTMGSQLAAAGYSDDFFSNNAIPHGFFNHPEEMSDGAQKRFMQSIINRHGGPGHQFNPGILEEGMTWSSTGVSPKDALLVDLLKLGPMQASHFLNVPAHKVGDNSKAAYKGLESEQARYIESSLGQWFSKIEFELNDTLLREDEMDDYYFEFNLDARLRGDTATRFAMYAQAIQWGIFSPNECREMENRNPYDGGDIIQVYFSGAQDPNDPNVVDAVNVDEDLDETNDDDEDRSQRMREAAQGLARGRLNSMAKRLVNAARSAAKKPDKFGQFVNDMRKDHGAAIADAMRPVYALTGELYDRDAEKTLRTAVDLTIDSAAELFLDASECDASELHGNVTNVIGELSARVASIANDSIGSE